MPVTPKEMIKLLKSNDKFFENKETNRRTTIPYHKKDLPKGTEQIILKQAGLK